MPKSPSVAPALSVVILAGGKSRRLGKDKSQLVLGRQTLLARSITAMATLTDDVIVAAGKPAHLGKLGPARVVGDVIVGCGALSGLHAGLQAARHDYALVVACDMPFLNLRLLRYMAIIAPGYDAVVPLWRNEAEPLHAIYARTCLPAIESFLQRGGGRIVEFYSQVNVRYLEPDEIALFDPQGVSFLNVNTPQDWERAKALEAMRKAGQGE
jgi:molybdopterin-guanine dinucleotide biosynthesis protein A